MPTYNYQCEECETFFEYFHSYKVKKTICEECGAEALKKVLSTPINIAKKTTQKKTSPGEVVKRAIEETKKEMEEERKRLRNREDK